MNYIIPILSLPVTLFIRGTGIDPSTRHLSFLSRCRVSPLILSPCMAFRLVAESVHVLVYHLSVSLLLSAFPSFCLHDMSHFTHGFSVSLSLAIITQACENVRPVPGSHWSTLRWYMNKCRGIDNWKRGKIGGNCHSGIEGMLSGVWNELRDHLHRGHLVKSWNEAARMGLPNLISGSNGG